jgi:hypothetical protein
MQRPRMHLSLTALALMFSLTACGGGGTGSVAPISSAPVAAPPSTPAITPSPSVDPMTQPRLSGRYAVVKTVTAVRNFAGLKVGDVLHRTYHVRPSCPIGPCGGAVTIDLAESGTTIRRRLSYDATTHTYYLVPIVSPVICTGADGRTYRLKNTTDTVVITPVKTEPTGVDVLATTWTGVEVLKAVPDGPALSKGRCRIVEVNYRYAATL